MAGITLMFELAAFIVWLVTRNRMQTYYVQALVAGDAVGLYVEAPDFDSAYDAERLLLFGFATCALATLASRLSTIRAGGGSRCSYSHSYEADVVKPLTCFLRFLHHFRWFLHLAWSCFDPINLP